MFTPTKSDINKLKDWFNQYLTCGIPPNQGGGYVEDVTWNGDEDKPRGSFLKGYQDPSVTEQICSQAEISKSDISRFGLAFQKLQNLIYTNRFRNQMSLRMSGPFQNAILTLIELELICQRIKKYDPMYGHTIPDTELSKYF